MENENATRDEKKHSTCAKSKVRCEFGNLLRIYSAQICSLLQSSRSDSQGGRGRGERDKRRGRDRRTEFALCAQRAKLKALSSRLYQY